MRVLQRVWGFGPAFAESRFWGLGLQGLSGIQHRKLLRPLAVDFAQGIRPKPETSHPDASNRQPLNLKAKCYYQATSPQNTVGGQRVEQPRHDLASRLNPKTSTRDSLALLKPTCPVSWGTKA